MNSPASLYNTWQCVMYICIIFFETDIDECVLKHDNCGDHATCRNIEGSFACTCIPGFDGDGINCSGKCLS